MGDYSVMAVATTLAPVRLGQLRLFLREIRDCLCVMAFVVALATVLYTAKGIGYVVRWVRP